MSWGWSGVADFLQDWEERKGREETSRAGRHGELQRCWGSEEAKVGEGSPGAPRFPAAAGLGGRGPGGKILETQLNQEKEEKKKKKKESCISGVYYSWQRVTTFLLHWLMTPRYFTPLLPLRSFLSQSGDWLFTGKDQKNLL